MAECMHFLGTIIYCMKCLSLPLPLHQVFGMFLDTLSRFIEEHREYLDDWLFLLLLRLIHRQGMDMLSSVHYKLQLVLELIRYVHQLDR